MVQSLDVYHRACDIIDRLFFMSAGTFLELADTGRMKHVSRGPILSNFGVVEAVRGLNIVSSGGVVDHILVMW